MLGLAALILLFSGEFRILSVVATAGLFTLGILIQSSRKIASKEIQLNRVKREQGSGH